MAKAKPHPSYDIADNTYALKRQGLKNDGWATEVGDKRERNKFVPRVKISRWFDGFLEFGVPGALHGGGDAITHDGEAIVWSRGIYTAKFYDFAADPDDEQGNGSFEWELILSSAPPINSFSIDIRKQNVVMSYQPPLTVQEIADGHIRPDRVVGSYAVYHTTKRDHILGQTNYQVGKIGHLYRPKVTDANGDWIWGQWNTDAETTGQLTLTIDAAWLAAAVYPVVIDPTFGYTTAGGSFSSDTAGECGGYTSSSGRTHTASAGDVVTKFSCHCRSATQDQVVNVAVYDIDGSGDPQTRLAAGVPITAASTTSVWEDSAAVSQALVASTEYTQCSDDATPTFIFSYDVGAVGDRSKDSASGGTLPATWTHGRDVSAETSVYATYSFITDKTVSADGVLVDRTIKTVSGDGELVDRIAKIVSADGVLAKELEVSADGIAVDRFLKTLGADGVLSKELEVSADGELVDRILKTTLGDGELVDRFIKTVSGDGELVDRILKTVLADGVLGAKELEVGADGVVVTPAGTIDLTTLADAKLVTPVAHIIHERPGYIVKKVDEVGYITNLVSEDGYITQLVEADGIITE